MRVGWEGHDVDVLLEEQIEVSFRLLNMAFPE